MQDNEERGEVAPAKPADAARAFFEDFIEIDFGGAHGGCDAKEYAARDAEDGEITEDGVVHPKVDPIGFAHVPRADIEAMHAERGQAEAKDAAEGAEENTLDEQLGG